MAGNPISDPSLWGWYPGHGSPELPPPPPQWNGSAYEFLADADNTQLRYLGPPTTEPFDFIATRNGGDDVSIRVTADDADASYPLALGVPMTITVPAGSNISIWLDDQRSSNPYALDVTIAPPVVACAELGRVTRAYVSGYQRDRVHASRLVRGEKRCLVANFNGAIPAARSIASVTWRCEQTYTVVMANARISGREAEVDITAQLQGCAWVKCVATLDNGEVYTQLFRVQVQDATWFDGEPAVAAGPTSITAP